MVRSGARGDVDGDGAQDILLITPEGKALELWQGRPGDAPLDGSDAFDLRDLLFGEPDAVWDIDRALAALGNFAERRVALATGDRPPDRSFSLPDPAKTEVHGVECADFDGDGASEVVLSCRKVEDTREGWFEVLVFARAK